MESGLNVGNYCAAGTVSYTHLAEIGVKEEDLEELAKSAFCDVCTGGNPKDMTEESILGVYRWALKG